MSGDLQLLLGGTPEDVGQLTAEILGDVPDERLSLGVDCRDAVKLFSASRGQWRVAGMHGLPIGLDLVAVDCTAKWLGIEPSPTLLDDIMIMADEGLKVIRGD